ncbi:MAG: urea ABC transporter permease subunit UrtB [Deltaproteobacteria bacterium]|nr:urea ABC transporter permease subunit UrtB [Deltaproteobacteria bacterium]
MALLRTALAVAALLLAPPTRAALDPAAVKGLAAEEADDRIAAIRALAASGEPAAVPLLQALADEGLQVAGGRLFRVAGGQVLDALTGAPAEAPPAERETLTVNNRVRREIGAALSALRLLDPDRAVRLAAARDLGAGDDEENAALLATALGREADPEVRAVLSLTVATSQVRSPDPAVRLQAVTALGKSGNRTVLPLLERLADPAAEPDAEVRRQAFASSRLVDSRLAAGDLLGRIFSGISLASILLLAALGLAITYGVMGVINMAHGEFLMVGAYAAYGMERVFARAFPGSAGAYVLAAIPVAFGAAFLVGVAVERTVVRFLYGRPLETLLASWGVSLFLIQAARVVFGAQNVQVPNPGWMTGGVEPMTGFVLPWNRVLIIAFTVGVLAVTWLLLNRTRLGLFVRAVTQNRAMAGCVGVHTRRVDTLAFGLGAGIAGLGGVALSQIANVGPDMGQGYIIDSFLVVVVGGVGQLAGAVWAAVGLGILSKFLEASAGAVIAKILILVIIILVIQKRPQGLFALKGRTVEGG